MNPQKIHLWCPNLFEFKGGIQVYSRFLLQAILETFTRSRIQVFSKLDKNKGEFSSQFDSVKFSFSGTFPAIVRTPIFAFKIILSAIFNRPNLIITTHINFSPIQLALKKVLGIQYWIVVHGIDAWNLKNPLIKIALREAEHILAVSNYTKNRIVAENNLDPARVSVLPNTFDERRFSIVGRPSSLTKKHSILNEDKVLLTVCRFDSADGYKGYDQAIRSFAKIREVIPNVKYILVGSGSDLDRVSRLIDDLNLGSSVIIAGEVSDSELPNYYNLCDIFIMPSKGEGFGIVFLEALASGKPCIAGNSDGAQDPLQGGELGLLLDPDDLSNIAAQTIALINQIHPNKLLFKPDELRRKTIEHFGFSNFRKTLCEIGIRANRLVVHENPSHFTVN